MGHVRGPHNEKYEEFYAEWTGKQQEYMRELQEALDSDMKDDELGEVVSKVQRHYEYYYQAKDRAAQQSILEVITPKWRSPLEQAFLWIGGWRPSMVFHLLYAEAAQLIVPELAEFMEKNIDIPIFAPLSSTQLGQISECQIKTEQEEEVLSYRMAILQQDFADQPFVNLSKAEGEEDVPAKEKINALVDAVDEKLKLLEELLIDADNLRLCTLKRILSYLTPVQSAQYLVAAAQLQIALRGIGDKKQSESLANCLSCIT